MEDIKVASWYDHFLRIGADEINQLDVSPIDEKYLDAVKVGDLQTAQRMIDEAAKSAGYTVGPVYHGGAGNFNEFGWKHVSTTGEGKGFYFTNDKSLATSYSKGRVLTVYLRGGKEISNKKFTFTKPQVRKILQELHSRAESKEKYSSPLYNYGDVEYEGFSKVFNMTLNDLMTSEDDTSFMGNLINAGVDPELLNDVVFDLTGKSGIVEKNAWMTEGTDIYVATSLYNIKLADPVTKDDQGNVILLTKRFDSKKSDIRY